MSLKPGFYLIRVQPGSGVGGMFITRHAPDEKVTVEAMGPQTAQKWYVTAVEGKQDVYKIEELLLGGPKPGLREALEDAHNVPVVFGPEPGEWLIVNGNVVTNIYQIAPNNHRIGVQQWVGTEGTDVVVKLFPLVSDEDTPTWQFVATEE